MTEVLTVHLPEGGTLRIAVARARAIALKFAEYERQQRCQRDLELEIASYLAEHSGATTTEIQRGVRARAADVRKTLAESSQFVRAAARVGAAANAKCWALAWPGHVARPIDRDEPA